MRSRKISRRVFRFLLSYSNSENVFCSTRIPLCILLGHYAILMGLIQRFLRYYYFTYLIDDESVQIREGILSKRNLDLKFHRIQNVNIEHPFYFRPIGLVSVKIESAGSAGEEAMLSAMNLNEAEAIRERIRRGRESTDETDPAPGDRATIMLTRRFGDLVIHGLTNNQAWIILGGVAALGSQFSANILSFIEGLGLDPALFIEQRSITVMVLIVVASLMMALMLMAGLSVLGSIVAYWGFELFQTEHGFRARQGLVNRHEINLRQSRIQAVHVRRDWLDMVLGRMNVLLSQIHSRVSAGGDSQVLAPSLRQWEADELCSVAMSAPPLASLEFIPVHRRYLIKQWLILLVVYGAGALVAGVYTGSDLLGPLVLPFLIGHGWLRYMNWKRWGLAVDGELVVVRWGIVGVDHVVIPMFKLQNVARIQSLLMRRVALSTVRLSVASHSKTIPFLPDDVVRRFIDLALFRVESTDQSWM